MQFLRARRERGSRGAAAVEFALLVPIVLLLLFGIISYGYMLSFRQAMSQGASEGARAGAVWASSYSASQDPARIAAARARVNAALGSYGVSCSTTGVTCNVTIAPCDGGRCVSVTVTYPYGTRPLTPDVPLVPLPDTLTFQAQARVS